MGFTDISLWHDIYFSSGVVPPLFVWKFVFTGTNTGYFSKKKIKKIRCFYPVIRTFSDFLAARIQEVILVHVTRRAISIPAAARLAAR